MRKEKGTVTERNRLSAIDFAISGSIPATDAMWPHPSRPFLSGLVNRKQRNDKASAVDGSDGFGIAFALYSEPGGGSLQPI
jgi:hypothetical protein